MEEFLLKRAILGLFALLFVIWVSINMFCGKEMVNSTKRLEFTNKFLKIVYTLIFPVIFIVFGAKIFFVAPFLDLIDENKYNYSLCDVITVKNTNNGKIGSFGCYSIYIDKKRYDVPRNIMPYKKIKTNQKYFIRYFKNSKIVYYIEEVD